jgi:hypothetical protein
MDVTANPNITTVEPFAETLELLNACGTCGIGDAGLVHARKINVLTANYNPNITIVPVTVDELYAVGSCGIDDAGLKNAHKIKKLYADDNPKITTIQPFAETLKSLSVSGNCGIDDAALHGIQCMKSLEISGNSKISIAALVRLTAAAMGVNPPIVSANEPEPRGEPAIAPNNSIFKSKDFICALIIAVLVFLLGLKKD